MNKIATNYSGMDNNVRNQFTQIVNALNILINRQGVLEANATNVESKLLLNSLDTPIAGGTLLSYNGGTLAKADADSATTRAYFYAGCEAEVGHSFEAISRSMQAFLFTESGNSIVAGDALWLASTKGECSDTIITASGKIRQAIGVALETDSATQDGKVLAMVNIDPFTAVAL